MTPIEPRPFTWADGDRTIRFGAGAGEHAWPDADLLSTPRARASIPPAPARRLALGRTTSRPVRSPTWPRRSSARSATGPIVAWGGGRVIDTAKALAAARGGRVCAVPTTLSGAEMTGGHRLVPGYEERGRHRPVLVLADPALMTGQPEPDRRASAMNALAHAAEALYGPGRNPVASMAAAAAAGTDRPGARPRAARTPAERLALGALLAAYAMDSAGYSLHHVLCQTIVRMCGTPHAATNAAMLPHVLRAMRGREPDGDRGAGRRARACPSMRVAAQGRRRSAARRSLAGARRRRRRPRRGRRCRPRALRAAGDDAAARIVTSCSACSNQAYRG